MIYPDKPNNYNDLPGNTVVNYTAPDDNQPNTVNIDIDYAFKDKHNADIILNDDKDPEDVVESNT